MLSNISELLFLIGIIISFFLGMILIGKKQKSNADKVLVIWLFIIGVHLILVLNYLGGTFSNYPFLLGIELPLPLVHGPLLVLYVKFLTDPDVEVRSNLPHFLPIVIFFIAFMPFFALTNDEKIAVYLREGLEYSRLMTFLYIAIILSGFIYTIYTLWLLYKHKKKVVQQFSATEKVNLNWLRYLIYGSSIIWVAVIFGEDNHIYAIVIIYVFFLGYFGIKQVGIFTNAQNLNEVLDNASLDNSEIISDGLEPLKYEKTRIPEDRIKLIHERLSELMHDQKLYTNSELTLSDLASALNEHPNSISQVINSIENKNFFDYINTYRVEDIIQKIADPNNKKYTLLSLAYDAGFNSKSSFNRNFKKVTGKSPTEYFKESNIDFAS
jgi:AraC-like DNA-binding protein